MLWFRQIDEEFADRILVVDRDTTRIWGEITARAQNIGVQIPATDGLIAATALCHGLHIMTRNTKHFAATGAIIVDPWKSA
jgi:predicted nucleic acid-binding protein